MAPESTLAATLVETPIAHLMAHGPCGLVKSTGGEAAMSISIIDKQAVPAGETSIASDSWVTVLSRLAKVQIARIVERRRVRRDVEALLSMDDRTLADIGLRRCEVEYAARYGRRPVDPAADDDRHH